jgi:hypothetical protein
MENLTKQELDRIELLMPKEGDMHGDAYRRFVKKVNNDAGAGLYDCVHFDKLINIIRKLASKHFLVSSLEKENTELKETLQMISKPKKCDHSWVESGHGFKYCIYCEEKRA